MPETPRALLLLTDLGFVAYWCVTMLHVMPAAWLFKDYENPILSAWNWSFLPIDLLASAAGLWAVAKSRRGSPWRTQAVVSLTLTSASGLCAISFWALRSDFDPAWWAPNLFLLVWPLFFVRTVAVSGFDASEPSAINR
jgi:Family of unknown function (DUF5360)